MDLDEKSSTFSDFPGPWRFDTYLWRHLEKSHVNQSLRAQEKIPRCNVYSHTEPPEAALPNSPTCAGSADSNTNPHIDDVIIGTVGG